MEYSEYTTKQLLDTMALYLKHVSSILGELKARQIDHNAAQQVKALLSRARNAS